MGNFRLKHADSFHTRLVDFSSSEPQVSLTGDTGCVRYPENPLNLCALLIRGEWRSSLARGDTIHTWVDMDPYEEHRFGPWVGFRVEVHDEQHGSQNNSFRHGEGSMIPRRLFRRLDDGAFRDHLNWGSRRAGPLMSFSSNWTKAMRRMKRFINEGAQDVVVIAAWLTGLEVYDAYGIACYLQLDNPEIHRDEFLLRGAIDSDNYRILAMFHGTLGLEKVALTVPGWVPFEAIIPIGFARSMQTTLVNMRILRDATEDFLDEIYSLTGTGGGVKLESLLRSIGGIRFPYWETSLE